MVSESTSRGLSARNAAGMYLFRTYIQWIVCWGCILFYGFETFLHGTVCGGYRLFIKLIAYFQGSKSGVQSVYKVSEPTSRVLSALVEPFCTVSQPTSWGLSVGSTA